MTESETPSTESTDRYYYEDLQYDEELDSPIYHTDNLVIFVLITVSFSLLIFYFGFEFGTRLYYVYIPQVCSEKPPEDKKGVLRWDGTLESGHFAVYVCNEDIGAKLYKMVRCNSKTDTWDVIYEDTCDCGDALPPTYGLLIRNPPENIPRPIGSTVNYTCTENQKIPMATFTCNRTSLWILKQDKKICHCQGYPRSEGVSKLKRINREFGALAIVYCNKSQTFPRTIFQCNHLGMWEMLVNNSCVCTGVPDYPLENDYFERLTPTEEGDCLNLHCSPLSNLSAIRYTVCCKDGEWNVTVDTPCKKYYQVFDTQMNYNDAKEHCESLGGYIARVRTEEEAKDVANLCYSSSVCNKYYIGVVEDLNKTWISTDGRFVDMSHLIDTYWNNDKLHCLTLQFYEDGRRIVPVECDRILCFLCYLYKTRAITPFVIKVTFEVARWICDDKIGFVAPISKIDSILNLEIDDETIDKCFNGFYIGGRNWLRVWKNSDGSELIYSNFEEAPSDFDENCVVLSKQFNYKWQKVSCYTLACFICELSDLHLPIKEPPKVEIKDALCPEEWYYHDGSCFAVNLKAVNSSEAELLCNSTNSSLLYLKNEDEQFYIEYILRSEFENQEMAFHTGMRRYVDENDVADNYWLTDLLYDFDLFIEKSSNEEPKVELKARRLPNASNEIDTDDTVDKTNETTTDIMIITTSIELENVTTMSPLETNTNLTTISSNETTTIVSPSSTVKTSSTPTPTAKPTSTPKPTPTSKATPTPKTTSIPKTTLIPKTPSTSATLTTSKPITTHASDLNATSTVPPLKSTPKTTSTPNITTPKVTSTSQKVTTPIVISTSQSITTPKTISTSQRTTTPKVSTSAPKLTSTPSTLSTPKSTSIPVNFTSTTPESTTTVTPVSTLQPTTTPTGTEVTSASNVTETEIPATTEAETEASHVTEEEHKFVFTEPETTLSKTTTSKSEPRSALTEIPVTEPGLPIPSHPPEATSIKPKESRQLIENATTSTELTLTTPENVTEVIKEPKTYCGVYRPHMQSWVFEECNNTFYYICRRDIMCPMPEQGSEFSRLEWDNDRFPCAITRYMCGHSVYDKRISESYQCRANFTWVKLVEKECDVEYEAFPMRVSWIRALEMCKSLDGTLAMMENIHHQQIIKDEIKKATNGRDFCQTGFFLGLKENLTSHWYAQVCTDPPSESPVNVLAEPEMWAEERRLRSDNCLVVNKASGFFLKTDDCGAKNCFVCQNSVWRYEIERAHKNYSEAVDFCQSLKQRLAVIRTTRDFWNLRKYLSSSTNISDCYNFLLGIRSVNISLEWISGVEVFPELFEANPMLLHYQSPCVVQKLGVDGELEESSCHELHCFVCQTPPQLSQRYLPSVLEESMKCPPCFDLSKQYCFYLEIAKVTSIEAHVKCLNLGATSFVTDHASHLTDLGHLMKKQSLTNKVSLWHTGLYNVNSTSIWRNLHIKGSYPHVYSCITRGKCSMLINDAGNVNLRWLHRVGCKKRGNILCTYDPGFLGFFSLFLGRLINMKLFPIAPINLKACGYHCESMGYSLMTFAKLPDEKVPYCCACIENIDDVNILLLPQNERKQDYRCAKAEPCPDLDGQICECDHKSPLYFIGNDLLIGCLSVNLKSFKGVEKVYADEAFHPIINEDDFQYRCRILCRTDRYIFSGRKYSKNAADSCFCFYSLPPFKVLESVKQCNGMKNKNLRSERMNLVVYRLANPNRF